MIGVETTGQTGSSVALCEVSLAELQTVEGGIGQALLGIAVKAAPFLAAAAIGYVIYDALTD
jgi:hypothetical protein